jgi:hypothetical protein
VEASAGQQQRYPGRTTLNRGGWEFEDEVIADEWMKFVDEAKALSVNVPHLVAPSGSLDDTIKALWNYPTFNTSQVEYGQTIDPTNYSLKKYMLETGSGDRSLMLDRVPLRLQRKNSNDKPQSKLPAKFIEVCETFISEVLSLSKALVGVVIGKDQFKCLRRVIGRRKGTLRPIQLSQLKIFGDD